MSNGGPTERFSTTIPSPQITPLGTCSSNNVFDNLDRPTALNGCRTAESVDNVRNLELSYDAVGRLLSQSVTSDEHVPSGGTAFTRDFGFSHVLSSTTHELSMTVTGPDASNFTLAGYRARYAPKGLP